MPRIHLRAVVVTLGFLAGGPRCRGAEQPLPVPGKFRLVPVGGIPARLSKATGAGNIPAVRVTFGKKGGERRLLAVEAPVRVHLTQVRALVVDSALHLTKGEGGRLVLVVYETDGGVWFKVGSQPVPADAAAKVRLPVGSLRRAAFGRDHDDTVHWDQVDKVWVGLVFGGPVAGTWELRRAVFTEEPYRPDRPLRITGTGPGTWSVTKDPSVQARVSTPDEGVEGKPCLRFDFTCPGGRHIYALPTVPLPPAELEGYRTLRFQAKAVLPQGLTTLLVILHEQGGGQYYAQPRVSARWTTIEIPLSRFKRAAWARDADNRFDLGEVNKVTVGVHGTASKRGRGTIWAADLELVP